MKLTQRIIFLQLLFVTAIFNMGSVSAPKSGKTVYYFWAQNCSSCREAATFYGKPEKINDGASWTYSGIKFIPYRIADENSKVLAKNINQLTSHCESILKRTGSGNFVYYRRDIYEYYKKNNLPYYRKDEKYSRKDEPFPTPVFITGNRVILGFNNDLLMKAVNAAK